MGIRQLTRPTAEPVISTEMAEHLRVTADDETAYIAELIVAARAHVETRVRRQLVRAKWLLTLEEFPCGKSKEIRLPRPPLQSVVAVRYADAHGVMQTLAATEYVVDRDCEPGRILPAFGKHWPGGRRGPGAVEIEYWAGFGEPDCTTAESVEAVPAQLKHAIKFLVAHWYANRELVTESPNLESMPFALEALLQACSYGSYCE